MNRRNFLRKVAGIVTAVPTISLLGSIGDSQPEEMDLGGYVVPGHIQKKILDGLKESPVVVRSEPFVVEVGQASSNSSRTTYWETRGTPDFDIKLIPGDLIGEWIGAADSRLT